METGIDEIDLQVGLSGDILEESVEPEVQYTTSRVVTTQPNEEYIISQWTKKEPQALGQAYYIQTTTNSGYEQKKVKTVPKKRKNVRTNTPPNRGDGYRFSCDHCALTFIDPKEAIEHISQTHMPRKNVQQFEQETTVVEPEPAPEQLQVDMSHVRHHGQQQVLLLVDENEIVDEESTYRIQYAEPPPPSQVEEQIMTSEMGRKVEMIKAARNQKRLAKLHQQTMKQSRQKSQPPTQFIGRKSKAKVKSTGISKRKQAQPQHHTQLRTVHIEQPMEQQIDQVMHINQLDSMDAVISDQRGLVETADAMLAPCESGQGSVVVPGSSAETLEMSQERIHMEQFASNMEEADDGGVDLNAHDMFKVQNSVDDTTSAIHREKPRLEGHLSDVKPVHMNEKRFSCEKCGKTFFRKNKLLQHMDGHAEEKMHICHVCGKRFQFKTSLVHHLNCHSENPRFKCQFCGKILSAHKMLLKHLVKQHNQVVDSELVPIHKCDICNYKTIYKSDLTKHKRKHTGEKPYRCPICFKEFSDSSILRRHEVVHTGEKPWKCYLCDKAYTLRSTLTNHFKKAHSTWPNPIPACPICKREFENREDIFAHMKDVHGTDPATINAHRHSMAEEKEESMVIRREESQPTVINDFKGLAPGVQILMNGEPLQIISVDGNATGDQQTIQVDAEGRQYITATHDGQPLELVVQSDAGQIYEEDVRQGRIVKLGPSWQLGKAESDRIPSDQGESYPRIVMMNEDPERKYSLMVSNGQNVTHQQIIYTEAGENVKGQMSSVVMSSPTSTPVSLIQTVAVPQSPTQ